MAWLKDNLDPAGRTDRGAYQIVSGALLGIVWAMMVVWSDDRRLSLGAAPIVLLIYTMLIMLTVRRLRDAGLSVSWVVLMIFTINFGPQWRLTSSFYLQLSDMIPLIPVAIGWRARSADVVGDGKLAV